MGRLLILLSIIIFLYGCADTDEQYPPKWIIASYSLPRMEGLQHAGFFEIENRIYSHHCDNHGNMIRMKYDENENTWKRVKYESLGCGE
tara:strand:- start:9762 stop:10028 length:267 start_codon:yes stop_codon:yes gene_type:complete